MISPHPNHYFKVYIRPNVKYNFGASFDISYMADMKYVGDTSIDGRHDFVKQYCTDNQLDPTKTKFHFSFKRKD